MADDFVSETVDVYIIQPLSRRDLALDDVTIFKPSAVDAHRVLQHTKDHEILYRRGKDERTIELNRKAALLKLRKSIFEEFQRTSVAKKTSPKQNITKHGRKSRVKDEFIPLKTESRPLRNDQSDAEVRSIIDDRVSYLNGLFPTIAPMNDEKEIIKHYDLKVEIISDDEQTRESEDTSYESRDEIESTNESEQEDSGMPSVEREEEDDVPAMTVETRTTAFHRKEIESSAPKIGKQDDWIQCDKCQKWRRLPNHVNVESLPTVWYCKMNRWDKKHNKCSAVEEKPLVLLSGSDLVDYRERQYAASFSARMQRMEKAVAAHKRPVETLDDDVKPRRQAVQCVECLKLRPLLDGMDASKVPQPFVCWMNGWDEVHASCGAPQGALYPLKKMKTK